MMKNIDPRFHGANGARQAYYEGLKAAKTLNRLFAGYVVSGTIRLEDIAIDYPSLGMSRTYTSQQYIAFAKAAIDLALEKAIEEAGGVDDGGTG